MIEIANPMMLIAIVPAIAAIVKHTTGGDWQFHAYSTLLIVVLAK
jgi:hypothetical protein